ncbi:hypothetical protein OC842_006904 [Tilletia horrida]|uniref:Autophagy-related protein 14 n=1 Tax=Tilletia horrida TaxID=155126 RepID=A0AAN6G7P7_9BASI|nr:hypothetical protein OC842_006904 [Tilletia horrida]
MNGTPASSEQQQQQQEQQQERPEEPEISAGHAAKDLTDAVKVDTASSPHAGEKFRNAEASTSSSSGHLEDTLLQPQSPPAPTPSAEELNQLELELSQRLQKSEWKPSVQPWQRTLARSQARFRLHCVKEELADLQEECNDARRRLNRRRAEFAARRERLKSARELEAAEQKRAEEYEKQNTALRKSSVTLGLSLHRRRVILLRSLEQIYPIDLTDPANFLFSIAGIPLPSGTSSSLEDGKQRSKGKEKAAEPEITLKSQDPEVTAAALGMVAQLVTLLSAYLDTPVHYPLATAGSRSVVQDAISIMNGPRAFPLYSKGVESYRFEYAVFLLNKDIEQLVNEHHVPLIDLRQTLPNLKNLMNTVISANSPKATTSSASSMNPAAAGAMGGGAAATGGHGPSARLHSAASVSISVASASGSTNGSDITLPGSGMRSPGGSGSTEGAGGRRGASGLGPGNGNGNGHHTAAAAGGAGSRSVSSASVASTWAASLLGWKTYYSATNGGSSSNASSETNLLAPSITGDSRRTSILSSDDGRGGRGGADADADESADSSGSILGLGLGGTEKRDDGQSQSQGPPTVRRLGTSN